MARAQFHKNQRVYVRPVGTWAQIERVVPHWTKGLEEPIRIHYDVGLGREFAAEELQTETAQTPQGDESELWRVVRGRNKWQSDAETASHPYPGTHPVVLTGDVEWGGWRVPGAEYALSPVRVERQARLIAGTPRLLAVVKKLAEWAKASPGAVPEALKELVRQSEQTLTALEDTSKE